jgi:hypothetical protein
MSTENTQNTDDLNLEQYETQNRQLIDAIIEAEDGVCKNASTAASVMIRRRIRENGFTRKIIPPKQIGNEDLTRLQDSELPAIVEDMEGDQATAKSISFNDTPDTEFYRGERFTVVFNKIFRKFQNPLQRMADSIARPSTKVIASRLPTGGPVSSIRSITAVLRRPTTCWTAA